MAGWWAVAAALLGLVACRPPAPRATSVPSGTGPRLIVVIVADGLSAEQLARRAERYRGGLRRLLDEGAQFVEARYRHINTETCPGHASLATGRVPAAHGVPANEWYEWRGGSLEPAYCVAPAGVSADPTAAYLRVPTLADALLARHPDARTMAIAGKDRSAILLAGRDPRHAPLWFDKKAGVLRTSAAYTAADPAAPRWTRLRALVDGVNARHGGAALCDGHRLWRPLAAAPVDVPPNIARFQTPDFGLRFPHDLCAPLTADQNPYDGVYRSPVLDELVAELAVRALRDEALALGRGSAPDLLLLSFSAHDVVAHNYGVESHEAADTLLRLDAQLGAVLAAIESAVGRDRALVALSADHGFGRIPELTDGRRLYVRRAAAGTAPRGVPSVGEQLDAALAARLCLGRGASPLLAGIEGWNVFYARPATPIVVPAGPARNPRCPVPGTVVTPALLDAVLPEAVAALFPAAIERVVPTSGAAAWPDDGLHAALRNDLVPGRSGDAFLVPRPGVLLHWDPVRGSGHGSHHDADTHVPLVFWGAGFRPARLDTPASPYDLAATIADAVGLDMGPLDGPSRLPRDVGPGRD